MHKHDCEYAYRGWYPSSENELRSMIGGFAKGKTKAKAIGGISPHAGYFFSGNCANKLYSSVELPENILVLSVSHHGRFDYLPLYPEGSWQTPLGELQINQELNAALLEVPNIIENADAHDSEHSGEIQLPFIKYYRPDAKISIINVGLSPLYHRGETAFSTIQEFGENIGKALQNFGKPVFILASSDMSHEQGKKNTLSQDNHVLDILPEYDIERTYAALVKHRISMCGGIPALIMMTAARVLGAHSSEILEYYTSADITGDDNGYTVGYCSAIFK